MPGRSTRSTGTRSIIISRSTGTGTGLAWEANVGAGSHAKHHNLLFDAPVYVERPENGKHALDIDSYFIVSFVAACLPHISKCPHPVVDVLEYGSMLREKIKGVLDVAMT